MSEEIIDLMIEGGKATATPTMAQQIGPLGINVGEIVGNINEKTEGFKGMKVPVKVIVDTETKNIDITVGTPPASELIKKELNLDKGSGTPDKVKVGNMGIEQIIKVAKMKNEGMIAGSLPAAAKTIMGTCNSLGILIEGVSSSEINLDDFKKELDGEITEMNADKAAKLKKQLKNVQSKLDSKYAKMKQEAEEAAAEEAEADAEGAEEESTAEGETPEEGAETPSEEGAEESAPKEEEKSEE